MCSIFGIGFFRDHKFTSESFLTGVVSRLLKEAEIGGRRASGLSVMRVKKNYVMRRPMSGSELASSQEYLDFMRKATKNIKESNNEVMSIIGHCRWPTQGHESNNLNNHPQVIDSIIGIHNGVINNDQKLFTQFNELIERKAEVDTEIIFQLINYFDKNSKAHTSDAIKRAASYLNGSFACALQNACHPYYLYLFRHYNPIRILYYPTKGVLFFATREHFITSSYEESMDSVKGTAEPIDIINDQCMSINLWNRTYNKFLFRSGDARQ